MAAGSDDIAISIKDITKTFRVPTEASSGIKQKLINTLKGRKGYREFTPLKDISFDIKKGDFFGIVGRNGSGKSTLLKLISGIYSPDSGAIAVKGTLTPFIELGVGFNPDLTGRENIFLNGALLGFSHSEMESMYDDIVGFAELADFMDQRLKNYSSGMQVRLAFSIAIRARSDILVLDEVLAVGDEAFQRKCSDYFASVKKTGKTVVLVTHDMESVKKYCNKAMMLREGEIVAYGNPEDVANEYSLENNQTLAALSKEAKTDKAEKNIKVKNIKIKMLSPSIIDEETPVRIKVSYETSEKETGIFICLVDTANNVPLYDCPLRHIKGTKVDRELSINITEINNANIKVSASIRDSENNIIGFLSDNQLPSFLFRRKDHSVHKPQSTYGIINNNGKWDT